MRQPRPAVKGCPSSIGSHHRINSLNSRFRRTGRPVMKPCRPVNSQQRFLYSAYSAAKRILTSLMASAENANCYPI
jgi:hypothetical protein